MKIFNRKIIILILLIAFQVIANSQTSNTEQRVKDITLIMETEFLFKGTKSFQEYNFTYTGTTNRFNSKGLIYAKNYDLTAGHPFAEYWIYKLDNGILVYRASAQLLDELENALKREGYTMDIFGETDNLYFAYKGKHITICYVFVEELNMCFISKGCSYYRK